MSIHPTAIVSPGARLGNNVEVGPFAVIESDCVIGDDCMIDAHVKIGQYTTIGDRCRIYLGAFVGAEPQDHRFRPGVVSYTVLGSDTVIREYVTIHRSPFADAVTRIGSHTLLMAFVHVGHDCVIGNHVTAANHTAISGHVVIEDGAVLSGYILIHQFCRIGALAMLGARTIIRQDIPPYCMLAENECVCGSNTVGLRRAGFDSNLRTAIRKAIKIFFFRNLNAGNAINEIMQVIPVGPEVEHFIDFIRKSERGIMPGDPDLIALGSKSDNLEE